MSSALPIVHNSSHRIVGKDRFGQCLVAIGTSFDQVKFRCQATDWICDGHSWIDAALVVEKLTIRSQVGILVSDTRQTVKFIIAVSGIRCNSRIRKIRMWSGPLNHEAIGVIQVFGSTRLWFGSREKSG